MIIKKYHDSNLDKKVCSSSFMILKISIQALGKKASKNSQKLEKNNKTIDLINANQSQNKSQTHIV